MHQHSDIFNLFIFYKIQSNLVLYVLARALVNNKFSLNKIDSLDGSFILFNF